MLKAFFLGVVFVITASLAHAQERVATSMVDGRTVDLYADGTWQFREKTTDGCIEVAQGLGICGVGQTWQRTQNTNPDAAAMFRHDDRHYAQYIVESIGSDDGITLSAMKSIVLENMAAVIGIEPTEVPVLDVEDIRLHELPASTLVYSVEMEGIPVIFANTIVVREKQTIQIATFAIDREWSETHQDLHASFLEDTVLE